MSGTPDQSTRRLAPLPTLLLAPARSLRRPPSIVHHFTHTISAPHFRIRALFVLRSHATLTFGYLRVLSPGRWIYKGDDVGNITRFAVKHAGRRSGDESIVSRVDSADGVDYQWQPFACRLRHFTGEEAATCLDGKAVKLRSALPSGKEMGH